MCLGEIAQLVTVGPGREAVARGTTRVLELSLIALDEPVRPGDWVVVHSGFALSRLDPEEAREALELRDASSSVAADPPMKGSA
ncbi:HypC/HybG/HupF family hydrogenase formation chaperone [Cellulomonas sp. P24]|uniref:HypC/HybG/HupF family hydrogenase formation chaperone n=1 Tax=Cellulomonas sp. P24 TaxID=2885206 RepID=UPI00216B020E|nr:HypC/HybG/HupF family hydrogenase formation chaperone [Cellulomonas sp. P24]MCR6491831.1 HypC/HybG/HupF family hydrogenase formation chaperone [Cellulomonas sp. P24]